MTEWFLHLNLQKEINTLVNNNEKWNWLWIFITSADDDWYPAELHTSIMSTDDEVGNKSWISLWSICAGTQHNDGETLTRHSKTYFSYFVHQTAHERMLCWRFLSRLQGRHHSSAFHQILSPNKKLATEWDGQQCPEWRNNKWNNWEIFAYRS